jgi:hypothetical protein
MHRAREFSCFLVWHRLMGTYVDAISDAATRQKFDFGPQILMIQR